jgi:hypothetical protein
MMAIGLLNKLETIVGVNASQIKPGVLVRVKNTGQLLRVETILPDERLWLVNQSLVINVAAQDVELAAIPRKA